MPIMSRFPFQTSAKPRPGSTPAPPSAARAGARLEDGVLGAVVSLRIALPDWHAGLALCVAEESIAL